MARGQMFRTRKRRGKKERARADFSSAWNAAMTDGRSQGLRDDYLVWPYWNLR